MICSLVSLVANAGCNVLFYHVFGFIGPAIATVFVTVVLTAVLAEMSAKSLETSVWKLIDIWEPETLPKDIRLIYLAGLNEDGTHHQTKYLRREDYLPLGATIHMEGRAFRVDTVNFDKGSVSLQDVALAEMRIPVFREEPLALVRELYEEQDMMECAVPKDHCFFDQRYAQKFSTLKSPN